jgi:hypothetical protein
VFKTAALGKSGYSIFAPPSLGDDAEAIRHRVPKTEYQRLLGES